MQNIYLYIGDNATGKTRLLKEIIQKSAATSEMVVTNISEFKMPNVPDAHKRQRVFDSNNVLVERILKNEEINDAYDAYVKSLLDLICAQGDILLLDELDASLQSQDIIDMTAAISACQDLWHSIYLTGYNEYLLNVFAHYDTITECKIDEYNVYYIDGTMNTHAISEDDVYEYLDKIRG